jgi:hypothetical protein
VGSCGWLCAVLYSCERLPTHGTDWRDVSTDGWSLVVGILHDDVAVCLFLYDLFNKRIRDDMHPFVLGGPNV